jgi:hypothetical protein
LSERKDGLFEAAPGLLIRHWGGEAGVVFDASRVMTHLLDIGTIELLGSGPIAGESIESATLDELLRLGLLRRAG